MRGLGKVGGQGGVSDDLAASSWSYFCSVGVAGACPEHRDLRVPLRGSLWGAGLGVVLLGIMDLR